MTKGLLIGLTGGIASGKSTVGRWLAEAGLAVVDADEVVADLYRSGAPGADAVRELFGPEFLDASGAVDHVRLAERVFSDSSALERLEERIHPLVRRRFAELASRADTPAVLEATLLVEAGYAPDFDLVVTVEADAARRIDRAIERGLTEAEARARFEAQGDRTARERAAHRILTNDGTLEELRSQVEGLVSDIRKLAASDRA